MILLCSDTHIYNIDNNINRIYKMLKCSCGSAKGLNNKNSTFGYRNKILNELKNDNYSKLILHFGSMDFEMLLNYNLFNSHLDFDVFCDLTINNYLEFIKEIEIPVIVLSVPHPTVDNEFLKKGMLDENTTFFEGHDRENLINKFSRSKLPSLSERNKMINVFNKKLSKSISSLMDAKKTYYDLEQGNINDIIT